jgi:serine/threonine-protein kinase HipA
MKMNKCLYCYRELDAGEVDFHKRCSRKMFGTNVPPVIDFNLKDLEDLAKQIMVKSVAVTGVQPKLSLDLKKANGGSAPRLTIVGLYGDYILKPPSTDYPELPENESLTMFMAELAGINASKQSLIRLNSGEIAYLTKRFDRVKGKKIAVEDLCQLTESLTEHKYRGSIEKVGKAVQKFTANKGFEAQRLFELVLFSFLTGNSDMHLKNFSLIENTFGEYELSPTYDLLSTALAIPVDNEQSALNINGKKNKLTLADFNSLATSLGIGELPLQAIYNRFNKVYPKWVELIHLSFLSPQMQQKYIQLIDKRMTILGLLSDTNCTTIS